MTIYNNHIQDWVVLMEDWDETEIVGIFDNTSFFDILLMLDEISKSYSFHLKSEYIEKAENIENDYLELPQKKRKKFNIEIPKDIEFDPKEYRKHGVTKSGVQYVVLSRIEEIKNKLSKQELDAIKAQVLKNAKDS